MTKKVYNPGQPAPWSGQYPVVGPRGGNTGREITIKQGDSLPPVPTAGMGYGSPDKTKHAK